jgi:hypothetical protein
MIQEIIQGEEVVWAKAVALKKCARGPAAPAPRNLYYYEGRVKFLANAQSA